MIRSLTQLLIERELVPVSTIYVVGAGAGSDLFMLRQLRPDRIVLAEADPSLARVVECRASALRREEVWPVAITSSTEDGQFNIFNRSYCSSMREPLNFARYFPNVHLVEKMDVPALPFDQSVEQLSLDSNSRNILVLDVPGQGADLVGAARSDLLQMFCCVAVRDCSVSVYEGARPFADIVASVKDAGFDLVGRSSEAIFPENGLFFIRNRLLIDGKRFSTQLEQLLEAQAETSLVVHSIRAGFDSACSDLRQGVQRVEQICRRLKESDQQRGAQVERIELRVADLCDANRRRGGGAELLNDQHLDLREAESEVEQKLADLREALQRSLVQATKDVYRKIDKATITASKQVQAYIGVHDYLASGRLQSLSTDGHAWPVSPDFAQYLIELIELNEYDAIIEFGSGVSTVVMAKALARRSCGRPDVGAAALITFEHLEEYFEKTRAHLRHAGVGERAHLMLAPLQPYFTPDGCEYMYYNCAAAIASLAERRDSVGARILVVVDGPPGKVGKHARYPAMPIVLSTFKRARVDFLLDDYVRQDEKEIVDKWKQELFVEGAVFDLSVQILQKGACLLSVEPQRRSS